jgi:hypothetical protein
MVLHTLDLGGLQVRNIESSAYKKKQVPEHTEGPKVHALLQPKIITVRVTTIRAARHSAYINTWLASV